MVSTGSIEVRRSNLVRNFPSNFKKTWLPDIAFLLGHSNWQVYYGNSVGRSLATATAFGGRKFRQKLVDFGGDECEASAGAIRRFNSV